jgi:hypothetical protein
MVGDYYGSIYRLLNEGNFYSAGLVLRPYHCAHFVLKAHRNDYNR